jgi:hypothetical protein
MAGRKMLIIPDNNVKWVERFRFVNKAIKMGATVLWARSTFKGRTSNSEEVDFPSGSFIITHGLQKNTLDDQSLAMVDSTIIEEISSLRFSYVRNPRVAIYADAGSPYPFVDILSAVGVDYYPITSSEIRVGMLSNFDVLVIPGGGFHGPPMQSELLGNEGRSKIREFVLSGGGIWGSCAGCCSIIQLPKDVVKSWESLFKGWPPMKSIELINAEYWSVGMTGVGKLVVDNVSPKHPVMYGLPKTFELTWHLGPLLKPTSRKIPFASVAIPLVRVRDFTDEWTAAEHVFSKSRPTREMLSNTYVGRGIRSGAYGIIVGRYGKGKVCASGAHPEFGLDVLLEKWGLPAKIFVNFITWCSSSGMRDNDKAEPPLPISDSLISANNADRTINSILKKIKKVLTEITNKSSRKEMPWLRAEIAQASFGLSASRKWPIVLKRMQELVDEISRESKALVGNDDRLKKLIAEFKKHNGYRSQNALVRKKLMKEAEIQLSRIALDYSYTPIDNSLRDYGYTGILNLIESAVQRVELALQNFDKSDSSPTPYDLLWGWYLGALYDMLNSLILLRGRNRLVEDIIEITYIMSGDTARSPKYEVQSFKVTYVSTQNIKSGSQIEN